MRNRPFTSGFVIALAVGSGLAPRATAQTPAAPPAVSAAAQTNPTATLLNRRITVSFTQKRLKDVFAFVKTATGVKLEPLWTTDQEAEGLDRDAIISIDADNLTVLEFIEQILDQVPHTNSAPTWQLRKTGALQVGPRSCLNRYKRVQVYDVKDILKEAPDYPAVPTIDLQQALQRAGGTPFKEVTSDESEDSAEKKLHKAQSLEELASLIRDLIETDQWIENGGQAASIRLFQGTLIVNAPDYIHRQIAPVVGTERAKPS